MKKNIFATLMLLSALTPHKVKATEFKKTQKIKNNNNNTSNLKNKETTGIEDQNSMFLDQDENKKILEQTINHDLIINDDILNENQEKSIIILTDADNKNLQNELDETKKQYQLTLTAEEEETLKSLLMVFTQEEAQKMILDDRLRLPYSESVLLFLSHFPNLTHDEISLIKQDSENLFDIIVKHEIDEKENLTKQHLDHLVDIFSQFINNTKLKDNKYLFDDQKKLETNNESANLLEKQYLVCNIIFNNDNISKLLVAMFVALIKVFGGQISDDEIKDMGNEIKLPLEEINQKINEKYLSKLN